MKKIVFILLVISQFSIAQKRNKGIIKPINHERNWVDSVYNSFSFEEKIGQLLMIAAYSNKDAAHADYIESIIEKYKIGGLIFFQGGPVRQAKLINRYQAKSKTPLFIGIDAEWGLSMRLDSTFRYPWNMTLGAIQDLDLVERLGEQMGKENKRLGVHFNFAPVLDINTNPKNPIIGNRSFGQDKVNVAESALAYMKGLQSQGVYATAKHFPGHGDTEVDSHLSLPTVKLSESHIKSIELYPFKKLINKGLASIMVAHLQVPSLENTPDTPTSLSYKVVTDLLKKELEFEGLIFTDALNMKGASNSRAPGQINVDAFLAGNDILLFPEEIELTLSKMKESFECEEITEERLAYSVKKILAYKYRIGLDENNPIEIKNLVEDLNTTESIVLNQQLYENSITVLKNEKHILPIKNLEKESIAYIKMGDDDNASFVNALKNYTSIDVLNETNLDSLKVKLKNYTTIIIGFHKSDSHAWRKHDFKESEIQWIQEIAKDNKVILDIFARPYALLPFKSFDNFKGVVVSYQNNEVAQNVSAQIIFGAVGAKGKLPVSINNFYNVDHGINTTQLLRLGFSSPESVGLDSKILAQIGAKARDVVSKQITPGMQILVARKGKVVYQKSFGYHTFDAKIPVKNTDLYDLASLTKILSTLPNVMQSVDSGKLSLDTDLETLLPSIFMNTDKKDITIKEMLSHYARLQPWIPFYVSTLDENKHPSSLLYKRVKSSDFSLQVTDSLFLKTSYSDQLVKEIAASKLLSQRKYKYSDFPFIILNYYYTSKQTPLDILSETNFYKPLGANNTLYNPLKKFDKNRIPPTEEDTYFRYQRVQGYVHDMGAAMEGGIGGHAGVFSNSLDVAKIMQMYLQKGEYGGHRFFSERTFDQFNTCYYLKKDNRRAIGFDKPTKKGEAGPTCDGLSSLSFGHSGFTGTFTWADPETDIIYVFLSNRTYPVATENKLAKENVRSDIQQIIMNAIIK